MSATIILMIKPFLIKGVTMTPLRVFPETAKDFTKRFYDIVFFILCGHFGEKKKVPPSTGSWCPVKSRRGGGGHCDPACTYNGKSTKK